MGPELVGDEVWRTLFKSGSLAENPDIRVYVSTPARLAVSRLGVDQLGTARPSNAPGDIGSVEVR